MGVVVRGFKNAFRNNVRTFSIILILSVSIAMALVMLMSLKTVQNKINTVKSSIGNFITISPAGIRGFEGGGELLTDADISAISSIPNVKKVVKTVSDRINTGTNTNLQPASEAGSFGNRVRRQNNNDGSNTQRQNTGQSFSMPIMITGTSDLSVTANLNVSKFDLVSGEKFDENSTENVALVGSDLATKNNLSVGSTFQAYSKDIKVVGIFDGGNKFANTGVVMPISALQNLSGQTSQISQVTVETDSIDSIEAVQSAIKTKIGDKADIASQQDNSSEAIKPLENIKSISLYSLFGSLAAGAIIIFLTMVMIVRERRREIGVLKAIGSSNLLVVAQFSIESLVLTLLSSILGIILGLSLSNPILNVLINNSASSTQSQDPGGAGRGAMMRVAGGVGNVVRDLHTTVGYEIILYGLGVAILIAIIGSALPAFIISKVRPAEVLRSE